MSKTLVLLADGFEEIEALTCVDLLRRAGVQVTVAGVSYLTVTGSHQIVVNADTLAEEVRSEDFDMIVLPGGMPGAQTLRDDDRVRDLLAAMSAANKWIGAICAAPMALAAAGLLDGKRATCYPGFLDEFPQVTQTGELVTRDGWVVTGKGPGAAMDFALELVACLEGNDKRREIEASLQRA